MAAITAATVATVAVGAYSANKASQAQKDASRTAARAQENATRSNIDFQNYLFQQTREDNAPWREIGGEALAGLRDGINDGSFDLTQFDFAASPGYEFRVAEGNKAMDRSAASRGMLMSGAQMKALTRYNQDVASDEYTNAFNRNVVARTNNFNQLASLANVGQISNQQTQAARQNLGNNVTQQTTNAANAASNAAIASGNASAQAAMNTGASVNQGIQNALLYSQLNGG